MQRRYNTRGTGQKASSGSGSSEPRSTPKTAKRTRRDAGSSSKHVTTDVAASSVQPFIKENDLIYFPILHKSHGIYAALFIKQGLTTINPILALLGATGETAAQMANSVAHPQYHGVIMDPNGKYSVVIPISFNGTHSYERMLCILGSCATAEFAATIYNKVADFINQIVDEEHNINPVFKLPINPDVTSNEYNSLTDAVKKQLLDFSQSAIILMGELVDIRAQEANGAPLPSLSATSASTADSPVSSSPLLWSPDSDTEEEEELFSTVHSLSDETLHSGAPLTLPEFDLDNLFADLETDGNHKVTSSRNKPD